jgi:hypothetical protein
MSNERRQLRIQSMPGTSLIDTQGNSMDTIHTIKRPTHRTAQRRPDPVPIGVAIAEAYAARSRKANRRLRTQAGQALRKARATG